MTPALAASTQTKSLPFALLYYYQKKGGLYILLHPTAFPFAYLNRLNFIVLGDMWIHEALFSLPSEDRALFTQGIKSASWHGFLCRGYALIHFLYRNPGNPVFRICQCTDNPCVCWPLSCAEFVSYRWNHGIFHSPVLPLATLSPLPIKKSVLHFNKCSYLCLQEYPRLQNIFR